MSTVKAEFYSRKAAQEAVDELISAGVKPDHARIWNVIPEQNSQQPGSYSTVYGAAAGAALGGLGGLAVGGILGNAVDEDRANKSLPEGQGAQVVVDVVGNGPDIPAILRERGGTNIKRVE